MVGKITMKNLPYWQSKQSAGAINISTARAGSTRRQRRLIVFGPLAQRKASQTWSWQADLGVRNAAWQGLDQAPETCAIREGCASSPHIHRFSDCVLLHLEGSLQEHACLLPGKQGGGLSTIGTGSCERGLVLFSNNGGHVILDTPSIYR